MIPITSSTTLSIEKTAKLLQNLIDLRDKGNLAFPEKISKGIDSLVEAQQKFVQGIDDYLHESESFEYEDDIEMVTTIVQTCPEFLATRDRYEYLPCHYAAGFEEINPSPKYLPLFANIGYKHAIGGENSRGGLLVCDRCNNNALRYVNDHNVLDLFQKNNPPLFFKEDIRNYTLLHDAAYFDESSFDLVKYLCDLDPSCLYQRDGDNELPLHYAVETAKSDEKKKVVEYLLQQSVLYSESNETIGGLFEKNLYDDLVLDAFVERWGSEDVWDCIEKALSKNNNLDKLPILHQTIRHAPQYVAEVIKRFPSSVHVRDSNNSNRLPIHVALETGMGWSLELIYLISHSKELMREVDPVSKCPPFALAGMGPSCCDLRTVYSLLRKNPEQIEIWCDDGGNKYIPVESCKRRKVDE